MTVSELAEAKDVELQYATYTDFWDSTLAAGRAPGYDGPLLSEDSSGDGSDISDGSEEDYSDGSEENYSDGEEYSEDYGDGSGEEY